jgi:drug/metabolite transporter (DMT)-like permease
MQGATILVFGLFLFSIQDIIIKFFSDQYSVLQIVFVRGLVSMAVIALAIRLLWPGIAFISRRPRTAIARGLFGFASYLAYYMAVAAMPLAEVVAIVFTMPLFVTAMSALVLGEKVGIRRWSAVFIGFIGVMIILSPEGEFNTLAVVLAFAASITYAAQTTITRFLSSHDAPLTLAFNSILVFTCASGFLALLLAGGVISVTSQHASMAFFSRDWTLPETPHLMLMLFLGLNGAIGFYCLSKAYCSSEASAIAPLEYTYIIWAIVFGYLFWNEVPGMTTIAGVLILVSSSLYIWYRETQLQHVPPQPLKTELVEQSG